MTECQTAEEKLDDFKAKLAAEGKEKTAKIMHAAMTFEIMEIRPLADFGQGWEKSI